MANTITGRILVIGDIESIPYQDKVFYKRELVLDASRYDQWSGQKFENYPRFELSGNNCSILDNFQVGDLVDVSFHLSGRKTDKDDVVKYFTNIIAYKVETHVIPNNVPQQTIVSQPLQSTTPFINTQQAQPQQVIQPQQQTFPPAVNENDEEEKLPF